MITVSILSAVFASLLILAVVGSIYMAEQQPAHAVTRFLNCLTRKANDLGKLPPDIVVACFNMEFKSVPNIH